MRIHVINGRFQPFHYGHLAYATAAAQGCDMLVVGLTHVEGLLGSDEDSTATAAPHRTEDGSNPLSFSERAVVVEAALAACNEIDCRTAFTPFPIERPALIPAFVPPGWPLVTTLHEEWNREKVRILGELGYEVSIVCEDEEKWIRGRDIRAAMRAGSDAWREMVPAAGAAALDDLGVTERLRAADTAQRPSGT